MCRSMQRIINKKIIIVLIILGISFPVLNRQLVKADSGWDSSYDTNNYSSDYYSSDYGSSYSSEYGSSSYNNYNSDSSYSNLSGITNVSTNATTQVFKLLAQQILENPFLGLCICLIVGGILLLLAAKIILPLKSKKTVNPNEVLDLSEEEIKKIDDSLNKETLKQEGFNLYKKSEIAKSKKNLTTLKEILSEELYKEYEQQLATLKENHQKAVATDILLKEAKIISIKKKKNQEEIQLYLYVSQYDYIIDKNKKVIRGTDEAKYEIEYKITLEKNQKNKLKIKKKECIGKWIKN